MRITIKAKPSSNEEKVEKINNTELIVSVKKPPVKGLANKTIIHVLSKHFGVSQSRVRIISGHASRHKIIEI